MTNFNYNNRKSVGAKLGAIVAKDLRKRIKPVSAKAAAAVSTPLEISLESKELDDEAIEEISLALTEALSPPPSHFKTRVSALILRDNALTAQALKHLAPVVAAACIDLVNIDLKGNSITIGDDDDATAIETFLKSLENCSHLVRLDLGNNNMDDCRVFEIFAQVYFKQFKENIVPLLDRLCGGEDLDIVSIKRNNHPEKWSTDNEKLDEGMMALALRDTNLKDSNTKIVTSKNSKIPAHSAPRVLSGLPTIAYINFSGCSVGDGGALWLSWVLQRHRWVQESLLQRKWSTVSDEGAMLEILPDDDTSPSAMKMLRLAQDAAYEAAHHTEIEEYLQKPKTPAILVDDGHDSEAGLTPRRAHLRAEHGERRVSANSNPEQIRGACLTVAPTEGLEWHRTRIQRMVLEKIGLERTELWRAAIKLVYIIRQSAAEVDSHIGNGVPRLSGVGRKSTKPSGKPRVPSDDAVAVKSDEQSKEAVENHSNARAKSYAASLSSSAASNTLYKHPLKHRTAVFTAPTIRNPPRIETVGLSNEYAALKALKLPAHQAEKMVGRLPQRIFVRIAVLAAQSAGLLSQQQLVEVIKYAQDRKTLKSEMELLGKSESHQIWCVLEHVNCLMYEDGLERRNTSLEDL